MRVNFRLFSILKTFVKPLSRKGMQASHGAIGISPNGKGLFITNGEYMVWTRNNGEFHRDSVKLYDPKKLEEYFKTASDNKAEEIDIPDDIEPLCDLPEGFKSTYESDGIGFWMSVRTPDLVELLKVFSKLKEPTVAINLTPTSKDALRVIVLGKEIMGVIQGRFVD